MYMTFALANNTHRRQLLLLMPIGSGTDNIRLQQLKLDEMLTSHGVDEMSDGWRRGLARTSLVGIFNKNPCLLESKLSSS